MLIFALVAVAVSFIAWRRSDGGAGVARRPGLGDVIPRGAVLVAELDVAAVRAHPLTRGIWDGVRTLEGMGDVATICGRDPLDQVERLAVVVPSDSDAGFGVIALGPLDARALLDCASRVVEARGGSPLRERRGAFEKLTDRSVQHAGAMLLVKDGGPLVLAEPSYAEAVLAVARGAAPSLGSDALHREERAAVGEGDFVLTAVLTDEHRRIVRDELSRAAGSEALAHVLGGGVSLRLGAALTAKAAFRCDDAGACQVLRGTLEQSLRAARESPAVLLLGLAGVLDRVRVEARGQRVELSAVMPEDEAVAVVRRLIAFARVGDAATDEEGQSPSGIPSEVHRAPPRLPSAEGQSPPGLPSASTQEPRHALPHPR